MRLLCMQYLIHLSTICKDSEMEDNGIQILWITGSSMAQARSMWKLSSNDDCVFAGGLCLVSKHLQSYISQLIGTPLGFLNREIKVWIGMELRVFSPL